MGDRVDVYFWKEYCSIVVPLDLSEMSEEEAGSNVFLFQTAESMAGLDGVDVSDCEGQIVRES